MQKIATQIFIFSSIAFGIVGILMVLTGSMDGESASSFGKVLQKLLPITVFIILPSFALSVAGKYLKDRS